MLKMLWFTFAVVSLSGLLLWVLPSGAVNPAGGSGLLIVALVVFVPLCLVTMHRLRKKAFKAE